MTDFDKMVEMLGNIKTPFDDRAIFVKTFYDNIVEQQFTEICIGKRPNGDYPDIIFSFDEDTGKLHHVYP